jgi:hypothetical protein
MPAAMLLRTLSTVDARPALQAKLLAEEEALHQEGAHGMWELSMQKAHHADIQRAPLIALLGHMESRSVQVQQAALRAIARLPMLHVHGHLAVHTRHATQWQVSVIHARKQH